MTLITAVAHPDLREETRRCLYQAHVGDRLAYNSLIPAFEGNVDLICKFADFERKKWDFIAEFAGVKFAQVNFSIDSQKTLHTEVHLL